MTTQICGGFYGNENDTYLVTATGRIWHVQNSDGGTVCEVSALPAGVEPLADSICHDVDLSETSFEADRSAVESA